MAAATGGDGEQRNGQAQFARSVRVDAADGKPLGFLEVDRIVAGRCCGGIRASATVTAAELRAIAAVMTLKCGFVGLACGGAKGGVVMPRSASAAERTERLAEFGRALAGILRSGVWSYGTDLGTTPADVAVIRRSAGLGGSDHGDAERAAREEASPPASSSGRPAGLTVALSTEAALEALGREVRGARIAVQGAGAVGRAAIAALARAGARIVAVGTLAGTLRRDEGLDADAVLDGLARSGDAFTGSAGAQAPAAVLDAQCDALLVCADTASVDAPAAERLAARAVVCGANLGLGEGAAERALSRGIVVVPDFIAGAGGVLGSTLAVAAGADASEVEAILRRCFKPLVVATLAAAAARAEPVAEEGRRRALRVLAACDQAYQDTRPPTLLPERLAPPLHAMARLGLALERRARGSTRLAALARRLHGRALSRAEQVLGASLAVGAGTR